jgi:DNA-3-methyladenine glycosylase II
LPDLPEVTQSMSKRITTHLSRSDAVMAGLIGAAGPYRLETELKGTLFRALAHAISHQQLHANAANAILKRFTASCGRGDFPTPEEALAAPKRKMRAAGFSLAKIAAIKDLAKKTLEGVVPERAILVDLDDAAIIERITQVRGIGRWTVEIMLMFQLGRPDVLPVDDFGVRNGFRLTYGLRKMPTPRVLAAFGERWKPHRTAAAWYLWRAVDLSRAGKLPAPTERIRLPRVKRKKARRRSARKKSVSAG